MIDLNQWNFCHCARNAKTYLLWANQAAAYLTLRLERGHRVTRTEKNAERYWLVSAARAESNSVGFASR